MPKQNLRLDAFGICIAGTIETIEESSVEV